MISPCDEGSRSTKLAYILENGTSRKERDQRRKAEIQSLGTHILGDSNVPSKTDIGGF